MTANSFSVCTVPHSSEEGKETLPSWIPDRGEPRFTQPSLPRTGGSSLPINQTVAKPTDDITPGRVKKFKLQKVLFVS